MQDVANVQNNSQTIEQLDQAIAIIAQIGKNETDRNVSSIQTVEHKQSQFSYVQNTQNSLVISQPTPVNHLSQATGELSEFASQNETCVNRQTRNYKIHEQISRNRQIQQSSMDTENQLTQRTVQNQGIKSVAIEHYGDLEEPEAEMNEKWQTTRTEPQSASLAKEVNPVEQQPQSEPELSFQQNEGSNNQE